MQARCLQEAHHFLGTEHRRQLPRPLGERQVLDRIRPAVRDVVEKTQGAYALVENALRDLPRQQMLLVVSQLLGAELLG
jgi:hypothetical protein